MQLFLHAEERRHEAANDEDARSGDGESAVESELFTEFVWDVDVDLVDADGFDEG